MEDKLLNKYFDTLSNKIENPELKKELEENIEEMSKEELVELVKKYY